MDTREELPRGVRHDQPTAARMYDYFLGGYHNFEADRKAAEQAIALWPDMPYVLRANRAFLRRAVRFLADQGIDQFLDVGSGIPTVGNVHEIAQQVNPEARVVYVDNDPIAVADSRALLRDNPRVGVVPADATDPDQILSHPEIPRVLDLSRPVGVLVVAILHFVEGDEVATRAVQALRDAVAPGSYLTIVHASDEGLARETQEQLCRLYDRTPTPMILRSRDQIAHFFDGFELVDPGLVYIPLWRPEGPDDLFLKDPERCPGYAGVGRKI